MKKITTASGKFGPYETVDVLEDRYRINGAADLPFTVIGQGEISDVVDGDFTAPSDTPSTEQTNEQAKSIRAIRDAKLAECDWTQVADSPVDKVVWATYRQALRDITAQEGFPWTVTYPDKP
jgi:hypothetical protein